MQPGEDDTPDVSANDGNGTASSDERESFLKDDGHDTRSEAKPSDGDDTQPFPAESKDTASPNEERDAGESELLTLSGLKDIMAQMTKEADLSFLERENRPSTSIANEIRSSLSYSFISSATAMAYVDHLEKTIASLKEGSQEHVDLDREAVDVDPPNELEPWKLGVKRWKEIFDSYGDPKRIDDE